MKVTVHRDAIAILEGTSSGGVSALRFVEAPPSDEEVYYSVELPGTTEDDPPLQGTHDEVEGAILDLIEKKKFGDPVIARFREMAAALTAQPIPEIEVERQQLADELSRIRNARRTWLIEQIENGAFAAIEMLKDEFGESVKINVEVTKDAA